MRTAIHHRPCGRAVLLCALLMHAAPGCTESSDNGSTASGAKTAGAPNQVHTCGNGLVEVTEVCDDGNTTTESACSYGVPSCSHCNAYCTIALSLTGPRCGDGFVDPPFEQCDDGNREFGDGCSATCRGELLFSAASAIAGAANDRGAVVRTDGAGVWLAVWSSDGHPTDATSLDFDILLSRSMDDGRTWTEPAPLNSNSSTDCTDDYGPELATDGAGNWVAVWETRVVRGSPGVMNFDILVASSSDDGHHWTEPRALNTDAPNVRAHHQSPQVESDGAGGWLVAWQTHAYGSDDGEFDLLASRSANGGATWSPPTWINSDAETDTRRDSSVRLAADSTGHWVAIWNSWSTYSDVTTGRDFDIFFARSNDFGLSWTLPMPVDPNAYSDTMHDRRPDIATDKQGNWVAVWDSVFMPHVDYDMVRSIIISKSNDNGRTWSPAASINNEGNSPRVDTWPFLPLLGRDRYARIISAGDGSWIAAWQSTRLSYNWGQYDQDVFAATSGDGGDSWTVPVALNSNPQADRGSDAAPELDVDRAGHVVAVWASNEGSVTWDGLGEDYDILVARSDNGGTLWTAAAPLTPDAASDPGMLFGADIAADGLGNWIAVFSVDGGLHGTRPKHSDPLLSRSWNRGVDWTAPARLNIPVTDSEHDGIPRIATDRSGVWLATWHSSTTLGGTIGDDSDILVTRSQNAGVTWSEPTALNSNATHDSRYDHSPTLVTTDDGRWLAVWRSSNSFDNPEHQHTGVAYATSADAGMTWSDPSGLTSPFLEHGRGASDFGVAMDPGGRAVIVWHSKGKFQSDVDSSYGDTDIFSSRSGDAGITWTEAQPLNNLATQDTEGQDRHPQIATDGAGNWIAVWISSDTFADWLGIDSGIVSATSIDGGAHWTDARSVAISGSSREPYESAKIVTDSAGTWAVSFHHPTGYDSSRHDADVLVSTSTTGGLTWTPAINLSLTTPQESRHDGIPTIAPDGNGNWVALWDVNGKIVSSTAQWKR